MESDQGRWTLVKVGLGIVILIAIATAFAIFGLFNIFRNILLPLFVTCILFYILQDVSKIHIRSICQFLDKKTAILLIILLTLFIYIFLNPNLLLIGTYDTSVYIFSAANLAKTGSLILEDKIIWSYLGFYSTPSNNEIFTSQFLPGYISFLAIFYQSPNNLITLFFGNSLLVFLSLIFIYLVSMEISHNKRASLLSIFFFLVNYVTVWIGRWVLTGPLHLFLIWLGLFLIIYGYNKRNLDMSLLSFLPISFLSLVRPEGILYLLSFSLSILLILYKFKMNRIRYEITYSIVLFIASFVIFNCIMLYYYYNNINNVYLYQNLLAPLASILRRFLGLGGRAQVPINYLQQYYPFYIFLVFTAYNLTPFLILSVFSSRKIAFKMLILVLSVAPSFTFLVKQLTRVSHPWCMRHFWPVFIPLIFLMASIGISNVISNNKYRVIIVSILTLLLLVQSLPVLLSPSIVLTPNELGRIASMFDQNDVIITSLWDKLAEPLYFLHGLKGVSVYFEGRKTQYEFFLRDYLIQEKPDNVYILSRFKNSPRTEFDILPHAKIFSDDEMELITSFTYTSYLTITGRLNHRDPSLDWRKIKESLEMVPPQTTTISKPKIVIYVYRVVNLSSTKFITQR